MGAVSGLADSLVGAAQQNPGAASAVLGALAQVFGPQQSQAAPQTPPPSQLGYSGNLQSDLGLSALQSSPPASLAPSPPVSQSVPPGALAPPPQAQSPFNPNAYMHPVRDAILQTLGGAFGRLDGALQSNDQRKYGLALMQAQNQALAPLAQAMAGQGYQGSGQVPGGPQGTPGTTGGGVPSIAPGGGVPAPHAGRPTGRSIAPLIAAAAANPLIPPERLAPIIEAAKELDPSISNVNGWTYDSKDPGAAGRYMPALDKDQIPLFDQNGQFAGIRNADGSVQAAGEMTRATEDAKNASQASYAGIISARQEAAKAPYGVTTIKNADGTESTYRNDQLPGGPQNYADVGNPGAQGGQPPTQPQGAQQGRIDPVAFYKGFILPHEGGYNPSDLNGSPVNMGFNQAANQDIDVKSLNPDTAAQRFAQNYYGPSGAANLPPALGAVHADTYFINPQKAEQFLAQSKGNPQTYLQLRQSWMNGLAKSNPAAAKYLPAWTQRTKDLSALAQQLGGAPSQGQSSPAQQPGAGQPLATTRPTLDPTVAPVIKNLQDEAAQNSRVAALANQFMGLNEKTGTAGVYGEAHIPIPFVNGPGLPVGVVGGIAQTFDPRLTSMKSLTNQAWVLLRPAGSGRLLQTETQGFKTAFPNIGNTGDQNAGIALQLNTQRDAAQAKADFFTQWAYRHGGKLEGAQQAWGEQEPKIMTQINGKYGALADYYGSPMIGKQGAKPNVAPPWAEQGAQGGAGGPQAAQGGPPTLTPEQAAQAPRGTVFMTNDGRRMVRP